ncbi:hypothetical protein [Nonomuraea sp. NPDC050643]|uniref:hypothetical protein n=1 Tax=Nonomuraea sp. NPDC050643 TaxID=3155660 RepID=UPI0033FEF311
MSPQVAIRLVAPAELGLGRVVTRQRGGSLELLLDRTVVDPAALPALLEARDIAFARVLPIIESDRPPPLIRYFMERNIPGGGLVSVDVHPVQTDVYLQYGLMPQDMADEVAGHSTNMLRHFTL